MKSPLPADPPSSPVASALAGTAESSAYLAYPQSAGPAPESTEADSRGAWDLPTLDEPLQRGVHERAPLAGLRVRLARAQQSEDWELEARLAAQLARALMAQGHDMAEALRLARRALLLRDSPELRWHLAEWYARVGKPAAAAATLLPLAERSAGSRGAALWARIAVLRGRAGDPLGVMRAVEQAATHAPGEATLLELRGTVFGTEAPEQELGWVVEGYLAASKLKERLGDRRGSLESAYRAFELQPRWDPTGRYLVEQLIARECPDLADQVLACCAEREPEHAQSLRTYRVKRAAAAGRWGRVVGVSCALGADHELDPESLLEAVNQQAAAAGAPQPEHFDRVLARAGLHAWLWARLDVAAARAANPTSLLVAAARQVSRQAECTELALSYWVEIATLAPGEHQAWQALQAHAETSGDLQPLIEAYVRVGERSRLTTASEAYRAQALLRLQELYRRAGQRWSLPALSHWALSLLMEQGVAAAPDDPPLAELERRLARAVELARELRQRVLGSHGAERAEWLRQLAQLLKYQPAAAGDYRAVLEELRVLEPRAREHWRALASLLERQGQTPDRVLLWDQLLEQTQPVPERCLIHVARLRDLARLGQWALCLRALPTLSALDSPVRHGLESLVHAYLLVIASVSRDDHARALALALYATGLQADMRAELGSRAAQNTLELSDPLAALAMARSAARAGPEYAAPALILASLLRGERTPLARLVFERAIELSFPRGWLHAEFAECLRAAGDAQGAVRTARRWLALSPGAPGARQCVVDYVIALGEPETQRELVAWLSRQPFSAELLRPLLRQHLAANAGDASAYVELAQLMCASSGGADPPLLQDIERWASEHGAYGLAIEAAERLLAFSHEGRAERLLQLVHWRTLSGDHDGAVRDLWRAHEAGLDGRALPEHLQRLQAPVQGEAKLCWLQLHANLAKADPARAAARLRALGAALWDWADDEEQAVAVWQRAAELTPEQGPARACLDLLDFAGPRAALDRLSNIAESTADAGLAARWYGLAADVALAQGSRTEALRLAHRALALDASRSELLRTVEAAVDAPDVGQLQQFYATLERGLAGRFGEHALHYRAARELGRRGHAQEAVAHAERALRAFPDDARASRWLRGQSGVAPAQPEQPEPPAWIPSADSAAPPSLAPPISALFDSVDTLLAQGEQQRALAQLGELLAQSEHSIEMLERGAALAQRSGDAARTVAWLEPLIKLGASRSHSLQYAAELERLDRSQQALAVLRNLVSSDPTERSGWQALLPLAERHTPEAEYVELVQLYADYAADDEQRLQVLLDTAVRLAGSLGRPEEADDLLGRLLAAYPERPEVRRALAECAERQGHRERAASHWQAASDLASGEQKMRCRLRAAELQLQTGNVERARATITTLAGWSESPALQRLLAECESRLHPAVTADSVAGSGSVAALPSAVSSATPVLTRSTRRAPFMVDVGGWRRDFEAGDEDAGRQLLRWLSLQPDGSGERLSVCRRLVNRHPGDLPLLRELELAAEADGDHLHAEAVRHVLAVLQPGRAAIPALGLVHQPIEPERIQPLLLLRSSEGWLTELLVILSRHARHLFLRPLSTQGVALRPGDDHSLVLELVHAISVRLGVARVPVRYRDTSHEPAPAGENMEVEVALADPVTLVVAGGSATDSPQLRYRLGAALAATRDHYPYLMALSVAELHELVRTVGYAFGPSLPQGGMPAESAQRAARLWETIPPAEQRLLRKICTDMEATSLEQELDRARMPLRLAGLFAAGDLRVALEEWFIEHERTRTELEAVLNRSEGASQLCAAEPSIAALVSLAVRPEYAYARWQPERRTGLTGPTLFPGSP